MPLLKLPKTTETLVKYYLPVNRLWVRVQFAANYSSSISLSSTGENTSAMAKKVKKGKKKVKKTLSPEEAKAKLVAVLAAKTGLTDEEVLTAHDKFFLENPSGNITEKDYIKSSKVRFLFQSFLVREQNQ